MATTSTPGAAPAPASSPDRPAAERRRIPRASLSRVWTNRLDNAIGALGATSMIRTRRDDGSLTAGSEAGRTTFAVRPALLHALTTPTSGGAMAGCTQRIDAVGGATRDATPATGCR